VTTEKSTEPEKWSEKRWKQLEDLERLVRDVAGMNNSGPVLHVLEKIHKLAQKIDYEPTFPGRTQGNIIRFLKEHALHAHRARKRSAKATGEDTP
jgi:hypothetical protein